MRPSMEPGIGAQGATGMSHQQQWIEQRLLRPMLQMLVGPEKLRLCDTTDWLQVRDRFQHRDLVYPSYYHSQNFHGIAGGYLNPVAAITYDAVTRFASPPSELGLRQQLIDAISGQPRQILDLGCGTGSSTLMLKQRFPGAIVTGLDLSPYMLFLADYKAQQAGLEIRWQHGLAEATGLTTAAFDLITLSMLLHETPPSISQLILQECFRLLKPGGQIVILDGNQPRLRRADWLIQLFQEPYSKAYAAESVNQWMQAATFEAVHTQAIGWIHQLTWGRKPQTELLGGAVARSQ